MRVVHFGPPSVSFEGFCASHGLTLVARERSVADVRRHRLERWWCTFEPMVEMISGGILAGAFGDGSTPEEARADLANRLRGARITTGGLSPHRHVIKCPNEWEVG